MTYKYFFVIGIIDATCFLYLTFVYFAGAPAGNVLSAKFLFRSYIRRGANSKCPAREIINCENLNLAVAGARRKQPTC